MLMLKFFYVRYCYWGEKKELFNGQDPGGSAQDRKGGLKQHSEVHRSFIGEDTEKQCDLSQFLPQRAGPTFS